MGSRTAVAAAWATALLLVALAAAGDAAAPGALAVPAASPGPGPSRGADPPPEVAERWAALNTSEWSMAQLVSASALLRPPPGFAATIYYKGGLLSSARSLAISGASRAVGGPVITYVSSKKARSVYALLDRDGDGTADVMTALLSDVDTPQGMDWKDGDLYVSGWSGDEGIVWRLPGIDAYALANKPFPPSAMVPITRRLPSDRWHGERYMRFGPDGLLYISIGAPCNACPESTSPEGIVHASVYTLNVSQGDVGLQLFARGLRNVVGMEWHPDRPEELYMSEQGRDNLGDDRPDDKLVLAKRRGLFFGFPYCHSEGRGDPYLRSPGPGVAFPDPELNANGSELNCSSRAAFKRPLQALGPHISALGLRFYRWERGRAWPRDYDRALLMAQHGSWDRSSKVGYRVALLRVAQPPQPSTAGSSARASAAAPRVLQYTEFLTGFVGGPKGAPKDEQQAWGRSADVAQLPDGSILVSDDGAHTVYRVTWVGGGTDGAAPAAGAGRAGPAVGAGAGGRGGAPAKAPQAAAAAVQTAAPTQAAPARAKAPTQATPTQAAAAQVAAAAAGPAAAVG